VQEWTVGKNLKIKHISSIQKSHGSLFSYPIKHSKWRLIKIKIFNWKVFLKEEFGHFQLLKEIWIVRLAQEWIPFHWIKSIRDAIILKEIYSIWMGKPIFSCIFEALNVSCIF
jgi:hypothetical protein